MNLNPSISIRKINASQNSGISHNVLAKDSKAKQDDRLLARETRILLVNWRCDENIKGFLRCHRYKHAMSLKQQIQKSKIRIF